MISAGVYGLRIRREARYIQHGRHVEREKLLRDGLRVTTRAAAEICELGLTCRSRTMHHGLFLVDVLGMRVQAIEKPAAVMAAL